MPDPATQAVTQTTNPAAPNYANPAPAIAQGTLINPTAPANTMTPATTQVNQPTDTVAGQVKSLIDQDSPLMQQAARRANEAANSRGLLNSSIAVNAGQQAVLDAALPIATQDAQTYSQTRLTNQQAENAANQFNATAGNNLQLASMDQAFKTAAANLDSQSRVALEQLGSQTKVQLANIEADFKTLMQTSQSASDMYRSTLAGIAQIVQDTNMNAQAKATAINGYMGWLKNSMNMVASINGVDLTGLLNFGTVTA